MLETSYITPRTRRVRDGEGNMRELFLPVNLVHIADLLLERLVHRREEGCQLRKRAEKKSDKVKETKAMLQKTLS